MVDDMIATVTSPGSNVHLDLDGLLYVGGVPRTLPSPLPKLVQSRHGFEGCLASLDLNGETVDPIRDAVVPSTLVSSGCAGKGVSGFSNYYLTLKCIANLLLSIR